MKDLGQPRSPTSLSDLGLISKPHPLSLGRDTWRLREMKKSCGLHSKSPWLSPVLKLLHQNRACTFLEDNQSRHTESTKKEREKEKDFDINIP